MKVCQPQLSKAFSEYFYNDLGTVLLHKRIETFDYLIIHNKTSKVNETLKRLNIGCSKTFTRQYKKKKGHTPGYFIKLMERFRKRTLYKTQKALNCFKKRNKKKQNKCDKGVFIIPENAQKEESKNVNRNFDSKKRKPTLDLPINPS